MPKLIKTEEDYDQALRRIDQLMRAQPDTRGGDELELLATLVDLYEQKQIPIEPPDPIDAIKFRMDQSGLSQQDLVPMIGSASKVSEVLNGKRTLSLRMIRRLHEELGIPAHVLLRDPANSPSTDILAEPQRFPMREMAQRGWFVGCGPASAVRNREQLLAQLIGPLLRAVPNIALRQHIRSGSKVDNYALTAWLAQVLQVAKRQRVKEYAPGSVDDDFVGRLVVLSNLAEGPQLAQEFLARVGVRLVVLRHLPRTHLDGASLMTRAGEPIIGLTLRYDRLDNFWFTLCHELAHVACHLEREGCPRAFFDDLQERGDELEQEADKKATEWLIPPKAWRAAELMSGPSASAVRELADSLHIGPAIVAGRVRRELNNYRLLSNLVGRGQVRSQFPGIDSGWPGADSLAGKDRH